MNKEARREETRRTKQHLDELLDDALRESFPASDVPSVANPELDEPPIGDEARKPGR
jgi:hypothetical protein